jgi:adenosylhomocysteine nucleosidase
MSPLASAPPVAILTGLPEELAPVLRRAHGVERAGRGRVYRGWLGGVRAVFAVTGDGPPRAERAALALCREFGPAALYGAGIAGALSPSLAAFDLVVARRVRDRGGEAPAPDAELLARARRAGDPAAGLLLTVDRPVVDPRQKAALAAALAGEEPAAVDMESAAWARAAAAHGVPYAVVRAISDTAGEELPEFLPLCVGAEGGIRRSRVVARALARPASFAALLAMRRRLARGAEKLAAFLERLLAQGA